MHRSRVFDLDISSLSLIQMNYLLEEAAIEDLQLTSPLLLSCVSYLPSISIYLSALDLSWYVLSCLSSLFFSSVCSNFFACLWYRLNVVNRIELVEFLFFLLLYVKLRSDPSGAGNLICREAYCTVPYDDIIPVIRPQVTQIWRTWHNGIHMSLSRSVDAEKRREGGNEGWWLQGYVKSLIRFILGSRRQGRKKE